VSSPHPKKYWGPTLFEFSTNSFEGFELFLNCIIFTRNLGKIKTGGYMVNKEEFRRKIINTAGQIFSHYGFKKTTMDEIAKALKIGKSSIYYYFESKEDIFEAVVLHEANILRNELTTAIKSVDSPIGKMRNYVFVRMKSFEKLSNYYNAIFDKNLDHFDFIETIREKYDREELAILRLIIYHGIRRKVFNVVSSEYTAIAIQTTLKGLEVPLFWKKKEVNIEYRLNAILEVLFNGIVKKQ
jgi:AcrR family transcriptional regulator